MASLGRARVNLSPLTELYVSPQWSLADFLLYTPLSSSAVIGRIWSCDVFKGL